MQRLMMGKDLEGLTYNELHKLEQELTEGILSIKDRKEKVLLEQVEKSKLQEKKIKQQNDALLEKIEELRQHAKGAKLSSNESPLLLKDCCTSENEGSASDTSLRLGISSSAVPERKKLKTGNANDKNAMIVD
ncbi:hypothetical protein ACS0TY_025433 [Phlomoides rotata]